MPTTRDFRVHLDRGGVVRIAGDLDLGSADALVVAVIAIEDDVRVDLSGVTFIDSTGLRSVCAAARCQSAAGRRVEVVGESAVVSRLLDLLGGASWAELFAPSVGRPAHSPERGGRRLSLVGRHDDGCPL